MAETILTIFVYILFFTLIVTAINLGVALVQIIEDIPTIRRVLWFLKRRRYN